MLTDPQQAVAGGGDQQWRELKARYDTLQVAARIAWDALLEAYRPAPDGTVIPQPELLERYQQASALRQAAEMALFAYIQQGGRISSD